MPRVPAQQTVQDAALPGVRVQGAPSASTYGADVGGTLQRAGIEMYQREMAAADRAAVMEAETIAGNSELEILDKMGQMKGRDAVTARDFVDTQFGEVEAKLTGALSNDRQRQMFQQVIRHKRDSLNRTALGHATRETEAFEQLTYKNNLEQAVNLARAHVDDPIRIGAEKGLVAQKIALMAERQGWDDDAHKAELTGVYSKMNLSVISGMLERGNDKAAKQYYEQMKGYEVERTKVNEETGEVKTFPGVTQFTATDRDRVEKSLNEGSTRGEAHRAFLRIQADIDISTAEGRRLATNTANTMDDEKVGALVLQKLDHAFAQEDKRKQEQHEESFSRGVKLIDEQWQKNPTKTAREMVPPEEWATYSVQDRHTLDTYLSHFRDPGKKVTDLNTWVDFNSMKDDDLAKLNKPGIMKILNKLSESDQDKALTRWNGVLNRKDGKQPDKKYEKLLSNSQYLENALENSGHFKMDKAKKDWPEEDKALWNDIQNEAGRALSEIEEGAKPKDIQDTVQKIVDKHLGQKFKYDKGFFSFEKDVPAGLIGRVAKDGGTVRIPLTDIPKDQQDRIRGLILDDPRKKSISTEKIEQIYAVKKRIDLNKAQKQELIQKIIGE